MALLCVCGMTHILSDSDWSWGRPVSAVIWMLEARYDGDHKMGRYIFSLKCWLICLRIIVYYIKTFCCFTGHEDEVYAKLKEVKNLIVYKREEVDPSFHYSNNRRIMPIIVSTFEGYRLCRNRLECEPILGSNFSMNLSFDVCTAIGYLQCFDSLNFLNRQIQTVTHYTFL